MQAEISAADPTTRIRLLGINSIGSEAGNPEMCAGRVLPWLQDTPAEGVWAAWEVTYRDVVVLDQDNTPVAVYNLTQHDLADSANDAELRTILLNAAGE